MTRKTEGALIVAAVLTAITAIMAMVAAWGPHKDCVLQFPKSSAAR